MMKKLVTACVVLGGMAASAWGQTKEPEKKPAAGPKKTTVDLGGGVKMEMTLIPAGEFLMGSGESAEATAAFFKKTYDQNSLNANKFKDALRSTACGLPGHFTWARTTSRGANFGSSSPARTTKPTRRRESDLARSAGIRTNGGSALTRIPAGGTRASSRRMSTRSSA